MALQTFAAMLRSVNEVTATLPVPARDYDPSGGYARAITIRPADGQVSIGRLGDIIVISGRASAREILAANIEDLASDPDRFGGHLHIDYFPGHFFLQERATPLVIAVS